MGGNEIPPWVLFLERDCIGKDVAGVGQLIECRIIVRSYELFCVLKARSAEGAQVAFLGAGSFKALAEKVRDSLTGAGVRWRPDQYG